MNINFQYFFKFPPPKLTPLVMFKNINMSRCFLGPPGLNPLGSVGPPQHLDYESLPNSPVNVTLFNILDR